MIRVKFVGWLVACLVGVGIVGWSAGGDEPVGETLKPVASTSSGLLLEVPLDLSWFTRREFEVESATVGAGKIGKAWTKAVTPLPGDLARAEATRGLTEAEVGRVMLRMRDLFDQGKAVPVSDVGLISTQEDVVRKPMFNHIAAFAGSATDAYLLVQRIAGTPIWGYFAIVQDNATEPPTAYFAEIMGDRVKFEGASCFKCHSSGPLAVHPVREDLVSDVRLLRALNAHIADESPPRFHFPDAEKVADYGSPLKLKACAQCHESDGIRGPLHRVHAHPIRILVDFGHMPPDRRLKPEELAELRAWLEGAAD